MECHTHDKKNKTGIMRLYENAPNKAVFVSMPQRRVQRQYLDAIEFHEATFHLYGIIAESERERESRLRESISGEPNS